MQPFDFVVYFIYLFIFVYLLFWIAVMYEMYEIDALGKNQWQNKQRGCSGGGCNGVMKAKAGSHSSSLSSGCGYCNTVVDFSQISRVQSNVGKSVLKAQSGTTQVLLVVKVICIYKNMLFYFFIKI